MIRKKDDIEREVFKTMQCFEDMEKLEAGPYFQTRLMARIKAEQHHPNQSIIQRFKTHVLIPALLTLLILVNAFSLVYLTVSGTSDSSDRTTYLTAMASDYSMTTTSDTVSSFSSTGE